MTLLSKKTAKTPSRSLKSKLTSEEQFWNEVESQSKSLIANLIEKSLPISTTPKNFDLEKDADYGTLLADYENNYAQAENLPSTKVLAEEIAYEYLLLVSKSLLQSLSNFSCHQPEYLEGLTD